MDDEKDADRSVSAGGPPHARDEAIAWFSTAGVLDAAIQAGEMVPDFALKNGAEAVVGLPALLDRGPVVVVFTLGASSDRCRRLLPELQAVLPDITALGASLVAISPDASALSHSLARDLGLSFDVLCDEGGRLAALFGVAYRPPAPMADWLMLLEVDPRSEWAAELVPLAAAYVVATDCIADFAFTDPDPLARVIPEDVLASLSRLHASASSSAPWASSRPL